MRDDERDTGWPTEAGSVGDLPRTVEPPPHLEERTTQLLLERGLIVPESVAPRSSALDFGRGGWGGALLAAAAVLLVTLGFLLGRVAPGATGDPGTQGLPGGSPTVEPALYALLLYETDGYDRAEAAEELTRYNEYGEWVAEARRRGQFVTGEDFAVDHGWVMTPAAEKPSVEEGVTASSAAPLSGIFLITATHDQEALSLAESLPHLRHGGQVVVQEVLPTDTPPAAAAKAGAEARVGG